MGCVGKLGESLCQVPPWTHGGLCTLGYLEKEAKRALTQPPTPGERFPPFQHELPWLSLLSKNGKETMSSDASSKTQLNDTHKTNPIAKYHFICRFCRFHNALLKDLFASKTIENKKHVLRSWLNNITWQQTYFKKMSLFCRMSTMYEKFPSRGHWSTLPIKEEISKSFKDHWPYVGVVG